MLAVCLAEVDAEAVTADSTTARVGIEAHHDPRLRAETTEVTVPGGRRSPAHLVGALGE